MAVTVRTTEAVSTSGRKFVVSTTTESWKQERFETTVIPIVRPKETVGWKPYNSLYESEGEAIAGHDKAVSLVKTGEMDDLMEVKVR